jgi:hypothetical protein
MFKCKFSSEQLALVRNNRLLTKWVEWVFLIKCILVIDLEGGHVYHPLQHYKHNIKGEIHF